MISESQRPQSLWLAAYRQIYELPCCPAIAKITGFFKSTVTRDLLRTTRHRMYSLGTACIYTFTTGSLGYMIQEGDHYN